MQNPNNNSTQINKPDKGTVLTFVIIIVFVLLTLAVRFFVINCYVTEGISMEPTYRDGQLVWVYKTEDIKRGDVVVIKDGQNKYLIKRVVAFEGDCLRAVTDDGINYRIQIKYKGESEWHEEEYSNKKDKVELPSFALGQYYRFPDGSRIEEISLLGRIPYNGEEYVVKSGVFLMGDNRKPSEDSRSRIEGEFPISQIQGRVIN